MITDVLRTLLQRFKTEVCQNTVTATYTDMLEIAKLPVVIIFIPDTLKAKKLNEYNVKRIVKDYDNGTSKIYPPIPIWDVQFKIEIDAEKALEVLDLVEKINLWFHNNPYLTVGEYEFPVKVENEAAANSNQSKAEVKRAFGSFLIEGVEIPIEETTAIDGKLAMNFKAGYYNKNTGVFDIPLEIENS